MRVLDIDLDFFLADCCSLAEPGRRPDVKGCEPWDKTDVSRFLEDNCGLSQDRPLPGTIFETHDGALAFWKARLDEGSLTAPFHVTHIDAHSDLGIGRPGPGFVLCSVLCQSPQSRADIARYYAQSQLDEANYLLFALAFRWIASLENVRAPRSRPDMPRELQMGASQGALHLSSFASRLLEGKNGPEPAVPYREYADHRLFRAEKAYDFVTVAVSPRYAPKEADALLPVFEKYIQRV